MYQWDKKLETGYLRIDNQHMELVRILNRLIDANNKGKGKDVIFKILNFMTRYTVEHFSVEEQLQVMYNYPGYNAHKIEHDSFKETVGQLTKRLKDEGPSSDLVKQVTTTIGDWLVNHIQGDDMKMAIYIQAEENKKTSK